MQKSCLFLFFFFPYLCFSCENNIPDEKYFFKEGGLNKKVEDNQLTVWLENNKLNFRKFQQNSQEIGLKYPYNRITQFCVSPSNTVILALISRVFEHEETKTSWLSNKIWVLVEEEITNQIALGRIFLDSDKMNLFFLEDFKDLPKSLIRVNHDEVEIKKNEGYVVSDYVLNVKENKTTWGMKNFISHLAVDDSGRAVVSNNKAIYQLDLKTKEVLKLKDTKEKVTGIAWNKSLDKIKYNYVFKNHCKRE